eukprot:5574178-Lingulodinium_polyedra.AAC.1
MAPVAGICDATVAGVRRQVWPPLGGSASLRRRPGFGPPVDGSGGGSGHRAFRATASGERPNSKI